MSNPASSLSEKKSVSDADETLFPQVEFDEVRETDYSEEQYRKLLKKIVSKDLCAGQIYPHNLMIGLGSSPFNVGCVRSPASRQDWYFYAGPV